MLADNQGFQVARSQWLLFTNIAIVLEEDGTVENMSQ